MSNTKLPEVWLRGAVTSIPGLLQPVAHALLQAREEVVEMLQNFPDDQLWIKPAGVASVGFHLQHLTGVLDRLFTYAKGGQLKATQLEYLSKEGNADKCNLYTQQLVQLFHDQIDKSLEELRSTKEQTLQEPRGVGRSQIPSTVLGLLFHSAEHTMRHVGQLYVTVKVIHAANDKHKSQL